MAAYRVNDLTVARTRLGPGVICVRDNDLDRFAQTAALLERTVANRDPVERARRLAQALRVVHHGLDIGCAHLTAGGEIVVPPRE
mgnify:CR=1 FL=1